MSNFIYLILLLVIAFLISNIYRSELSTKTYMANIYLYIAFTVIAIMLCATILNITFANGIIAFIVIIIIAIISIFLIMNNNPIISHIGLLLFIIILGISISPYFNHFKNINKSILITIGIFILFTVITFMLPDSALKKVQVMGGPMICALIMLIVANIFFGGSKILSVISIAIFSYFIIYDTFITSSKNLTGTHYDINYPKETINNSLNFINILSSVIRLNN